MKKCGLCSFSGDQPAFGQHMMEAHAWGVPPSALQPRPAATVAAPTGTAAPPIAQTQTPEVRVKEYKTPKDFENDAKKMLRDGWRIQDQDQREGHVNVGRTTLKALIFLPTLLVRDKTKGKIMVTYLRGG